MTSTVAAPPTGPVEVDRAAPRHGAPGARDQPPAIVDVDLVGQAQRVQSSDTPPAGCRGSGACVTPPPDWVSWSGLHARRRPAPAGVAEAGRRRRGRGGSRRRWRWWRGGRGRGGGGGGGSSPAAAGAVAWRHVGGGGGRWGGTRACGGVAAEDGGRRHSGGAAPFLNSRQLARWSCSSTWAFSASTSRRQIGRRSQSSRPG
jgi:hypothetical protein